MTRSGDHVAVPGASGLRIVYATTGDTLASLPEFPGLSFPAWSPDGERLLVGNAIVDWRSGSVTTIAGRAHAWSPAGTKIASVTDGAERADGLPELLVHDLRGNVVFRLSPTVGILDFPAWSPDGTKVAFTGYTDGRQSTYIADIRRHTLVMVSSATFGGWLDDDTVHFIGDMCGEPDIYLVSVDGARLVNVTNSTEAEGHPVTTSPSTIAYMIRSAPWDPTGVRIVERNVVDGTERTLVPDGRLLIPGEANHVDPLSPDGRYLAFWDYEPSRYFHGLCHDRPPGPNPVGVSKLLP